MEYQWLSSWFVRAQGGSSIFFPDLKIRLNFFFEFFHVIVPDIVCQTECFLALHYNTLQPVFFLWLYLTDWSLFIVRYLLFLHRVFSTLAVTKISVIEYYPCHNTSNILHTYNKYNNPKGCLKYFEWKSNRCEDTKCILSSHLITIFIKGFFFKNFVWPFHPLSSFYCGVD